MSPCTCLSRLCTFFICGCLSFLLSGLLLPLQAPSNARQPSPPGSTGLVLRHPAADGLRERRGAPGRAGSGAAAGGPPAHPDAPGPGLGQTPAALPQEHCGELRPGQCHCGLSPQTCRGGRHPASAGLSTPSRICIPQQPQTAADQKLTWSVRPGPFPQHAGSVHCQTYRLSQALIESLIGELSVPGVVSLTLLKINLHTSSRFRGTSY